MNEQTVEQGEEYLRHKHKIITSLLEEQGIMGPWENFYEGEGGKVLPGGFENGSGRILTQDDRVFAYWLDWDLEKIAPDGTKGWYTLGEKPLGKSEYTLFREIKPGNKISVYPKPDDHAFLTARRKLNLSLTEEQLSILRDYWKGLPEMLKELDLE